MHFAIIARVLGIMLMIFSLSMLTPLVVAFASADHLLTFLQSFAITLLLGFLFWLPTKITTANYAPEMVLVTVFFWLVLSTFGPCL